MMMLYPNLCYKGTILYMSSHAGSSISFSTERINELNKNINFIYLYSHIYISIYKFLIIQIVPP